MINIMCYPEYTLRIKEEGGKIKMKLCWKEVIAVNMFSTVYFSNNKHPNHKRFFLHFFFKFMYLFLEANCFTILYWFSHTLTWICHGCTCGPHPESPSTSRPIPSLWVIPVHQPRAPCIMHRTWTGDSFHTQLTPTQNVFGVNKN